MSRRSVSARRAACPLAITALAVALGACDGTPREAAATPPPPLRPAAHPAPAPPSALDGFLRQLEEAMRIDDPLARCLAMPDLPGNHWAAGAARAHCESQFGAHLTPADVESALARSDPAALDTRLRADLDRHFTPDGGNEAIDLDLLAFDRSPAADAASRAWLAQAPDDAFALAARGFALADQAAAARGTDSIANTSPAGIRGMRALAAQAVDLLQRAVTREPRLLPAYGQLINLGMLTGKGELIAQAFAQAHAVDPACRYVADNAMRALEPRWGGSLEAMDTYAAELRRYESARPLLARISRKPDIERAQMLLESGSMATQDAARGQALALLLPVLSATTNTRALRLAADALPERHASDEAIMWPLVAQRFDPDNNCGCFVDEERVGSGLAEHGHPALAIPHLERALAKQAWPITRLELAGAYADAGAIDQAIAAYRAVAGSVLAEQAARKLIAFELDHGRLDDALRDAQADTQARPDDVRTWKRLYQVLDRRGDAAKYDALQHYVDHVDPNDPESFDLPKYRAILEAHKAH